MATVKKAAPAPRAVPVTAVQAAVAKPGTMAIALPGNVMERLAQQARDEAAKERPSVSKISLQGGELSYGGNVMPNNEMEVVIVGSYAINTYYSGVYDPDNLVNPDCFAMGHVGDEMVAHENVPDELVPGETRDCADCPMGQWESDPRPGSRGKACKDKRRLVLAPAGVEDYAKCELALLDVPVTSVKNFSSFVNGLAAANGLPPHAVVTCLSLVRDKKTQYKLNFTPLRGLDDEAQLTAIESRKDEASRLALTPYPAKEEEPEPEPAPTKGRVGKSKF